MANKAVFNEITVSDSEAVFNELTVTFTPSFSEFITLYRGVERVWISGAPFVPEEDKNKDGILFAEMEDGVIQTLGPVSAYFYAQKSGYTGTFEEWVQLILDGSIHAQQAAASAQAAAGSETNAAQSAMAARTSETNAATSASSASTSATNAASSASSAASSASSASASKSAAATSETNAAASASNANSSKNSAATSATNAANSASNAATSASSASTSASTATTQATNAANSASSASSSATTATNKAVEASNSASAAAGSASEALSYKNAAQSSMNLAAQWATGGTSGTPTSTNNSKYYAEQSKAESDKVGNMTVSAETLLPTAEATVAIQTVDNHYDLTFGIPKGDKGDPNYLAIMPSGDGLLCTWTEDRDALSAKTIIFDPSAQTPVTIYDMIKSITNSEIDALFS